MVKCRGTGRPDVTGGRLAILLAVAALLAAGGTDARSLGFARIDKRIFGKHKPRRGPGLLPGVPNPSHFKWTVGLQDMCRRGPDHLDIRGFPLNFPFQHSFREAFLAAGETAPPGYEEAWPRLQKFLPTKVWPLNSQLDSCAVVGHAHWMRDRTYGGEINQHTTVFRFNKDPTAGLESMVGTRTSYRIVDRLHTALYAKEKPPGILDAEQAAPEEAIEGDTEKDTEAEPMPVLPKEPMVSLVLARVTPLEAASRIPRMRRNFKKSLRNDIQMSIFNRDVIKHIRKMMLETKRCLQLGGMSPSEERVIPSLHLATVATAVLACNHVTVYGAGFENSTDPSPRHYANYGDADGTLRDHSVEDAILRSMARVGLVRLCGPKQCYGSKLPPYIRPSDPIEPEEEAAEVAMPEEWPPQSESDLYGDRDNDDFEIFVDK